MSSPSPAPTSRRQQIVQTFRMTRQAYPWIGWAMLGGFLLFGAIGFAIFWVLPGSGVIGWVMAVVGGLLFGLLAPLLLLSRYGQRAAYAQADGRQGAAGSALTLLRRGWHVDQMVAFNKQQDMVHRVVGPPGIVLVGEGSSPHRVRNLLSSERRKHERVAAETPIHEVVCGRGEGEVPLDKLVKHVTKLGREVKPADITDIRFRLKALDAHRSNIPMPKGPVPTNMKGLRQNMRGR